MISNYVCWPDFRIKASNFPDNPLIINVIRKFTHTNAEYFYVVLLVLLQYF